MHHSLPRTRSIRDPLHGTVRLTEEELSVVNHPLFQRLHRVRQNGLLYAVFPSATHTRFEHSIGSLHVADTILTALGANSATSAAKPTPAVQARDVAKVGQAFDFTSLPADVIAELSRVVRLAALAHDLGHGPFSHHFDPFAPSTVAVQDLIKTGGSLVELAPVASKMSKPDTQRLFVTAMDETVEHEVMSCVLFAEIADEVGLRAGMSGDVAAVILGDPDLVQSAWLRDHLPLAHGVVASAPADADRMDYLERDSLSVGVSYGLFDRNRLLASFLPYVDNSGLSGLGIKRSGVRAIENFVQARFELYVQIYYHKTNRAIQLMLGRIAELIRARSLSPFNWSTQTDLRDTYQELSDERFLTVLRGKDATWQLSDEEVNGLAEDIYARRLWKRVYLGAPEEARQMLSILEDAFPDVPLRLDVIDPKATKGLREGAILLSRTGKGTYTASQEAWTEVSPIIAALADEETRVARIYLERSDGTQAKAIREEIWKRVEA